MLCPLKITTQVKISNSRRAKFNVFILGLEVCHNIAGNGQGLLQGWNSLLVRPEPLLIKDIKVQVNKQKPNSERPAQMKHNSDKMTIAPMSCQPCSKHNVGGSTLKKGVRFILKSASIFIYPNEILVITQSFGCKEY